MKIGGGADAEITDPRATTFFGKRRCKIGENLKGKAALAIFHIWWKSFMVQNQVTSDVVYLST